MEKNRHDSSAFSVPGTMEDMTILSTPLPQAASTATKRSPALLIEDLEIPSSDRETNNEARNRLSSATNGGGPSSTQAVPTRKESERASLLENACKNMSEMQNQIEQELAKYRALRNNRPSSGAQSFSSKAPGLDLSQEQDNDAISKFLEDKVPQSNSLYSLVGGPKTISNQPPSNNSSRNIEPPTKDFEFRVPALPIKHSELDKKLKRNGEAKKSMPSMLRHVSETPVTVENYLNYNPGNISSSFSQYRFPENDKGYEEDRESIASSANSSLGIISPDTLADAADKPLAELTDKDRLDLSQRFAKELGLDTSKISEVDLDLSSLVSARIKETLANKWEEDKENKSSQRGSSDRFTFHSYSSDSSNSRNATAKEISALSHSLPGEKKLSAGNTSLDLLIKPLAEQNFASGRRSTGRKLSSSSRLSRPYDMSEARLSLRSNPFSDQSKLSIASDEFQSSGDIAERLQKDEEAWRNQYDISKSSLSGIYGDADLSIGSHKMSISSFLRSKSGPLGCLEAAAGAERPNFGNPLVSPEKKSGPRGILPPPKDEVPTKDTGGDPWNPQSLVEQFSLIHERNDNETDVSVPSLSCIGDLLAEMHQDGFTPRHMMDRLMAASRNKSEKLSKSRRKLDDSALSNCQLEKSKTIPSVVAGRQSFCRGYESDRSTRYSSSFNSNISVDEEPGARRQVNQPPDRPTEGGSIITIDDSVAPSICNISDFDGEEEEYVCVLMPESMDFDIFNNFPTEQTYSITKACYVNGRRQDSAALIHLPVTSLTLKPNTEKVLSATVAALVAGTLNIKLEVTRTDAVTKETETNTIFGKLLAELPKISLLSPQTVEMEPVLDSYYGTQFGDDFKEVIELKNNGRSVVPVRLSIAQTNCESENWDIFYFGPERNKTATLILEPGQKCKQVICCQSPPEVPDNQEVTRVWARVEVYLGTAVQVKLPCLSYATFKAALKPNFYGVPSKLLVPFHAPARLRLFNSGVKAVRFRVVTNIPFSVQPSAFVVQPSDTSTVLVTFMGGNYKSGTLTLHTYETGAMHTIQLQATTPSNSTRSSLATPQSSRAPSPTSPSSTSVAEGKFQLACTHKELVWGGCPLQQRVVRTCSLKNQNAHREKLRLKITDQHNCFKILTDKKGLESELKLSLQPMENRQISVVMLAGSTGPKWGRLTVSRINNPMDKKVLPLYGFGGKAKVNIEGILQDPEQHMWLYLDPDSLSSCFTLINNGDYAAFIKVHEGMTATTVGGGLSIAPPEHIIPPGHTVPVEISLSITPERLEYLLAQSSQTAICITRLTVTHGDESTRLRLSRLSRDNSTLANKLTLLNQLLPLTPIPDLDKLSDPASCAETLWLEDVREWTIGVLIKRSALEALRLDTSVEFVDLANTVIQ